MGALISKMENMDEDLQILKAENKQLKAILNKPEVVFKKAGFVKTSTPFSEDMISDPFRAENEILLKGGEMQHSTIPQTNEEFHALSWDRIHEMASTVKKE
tara:strand:+ start:190 stop:492 length:303 start_codon:yes stop_codon:yes gene_type:complete